MTRSALLVLGALACVFAVGCSDSLREPKQPSFVASDDTIDTPPAEPAALPDDPSVDDRTRERALRVMAGEQRAALANVASESRFVRTSLQSRVRNATSDTERELDAIDREISRLENAELDSSTRRDRHDEIKARLRRVASRVSLMETAVRGN